MTIARTAGVLIGTNETTGVTIAAGATATGNEVNVLGTADCKGDIDAYLIFTLAAAVVTGSIRVDISYIRATGGLKFVAHHKVVNASGLPAGTYNIYLGRLPIQQYASANVINGGDQELTNVAVLYNLEKTT